MITKRIQSHMNDIQTITNIAKNYDLNFLFAKKIYQSSSGTNIDELIKKTLSEKPKPFVKWTGGKRQLLKQFRNNNIYPPLEFDLQNNTYFEPFVGGGAVFFDLLPENAYLSDLNKELVITYNVIKNEVEKLIDSLKKHQNTKEYFLEIRAKIANDMTNLEIASRFIYLNKTAFNGMYRVNKSGNFNVPYGKYSNPTICDEENLRRVSKNLKNVTIAHSDYKIVLKKAKKGDFIYFDPPYYPINKTSSFTSYTSEEFLEKEQIELRDTFKKLHLRGCYVMLSNSDTPFVDGIYKEIKDVTINKIQASRVINSDATKRGKISEIVVTNY